MELYSKLLVAIELTKLSCENNKDILIGIGIGTVFTLTTLVVILVLCPKSKN